MITADRQKIIQSIILSKEILIRQAKVDFKKFVLYLSDAYDMQWFHAVICERLKDFASGKIKKLMINMPPQHGKSELSTRLFPAWLLGVNPNIKIAITSYSDTMASGFNRAVQRNMDNEKYGILFPETKLNNSQQFKTNFTNYSRTEHLFEIVGKSGSLRSVGRGGALTGNPVDIGIIDDLYKDRDEAKSIKISESTWNWYVDVFRTRLHNDSQELIMTTRWDENDICGRLLEEEGDKWTLIKFPAIKTEDENDYDIREPGETLWEAKHSKEKIEGQRSLSQVSYNSLYQQDPKPNTDILIFADPQWIEIPEWPTVEDIEGKQTPLEIKSWGLDFGKTTGINALIKHSYNGDKAYFDECCYEPGLSSKAIREILITSGYKGEPVFCDHMPTKIAELRRLGIAALPATKGEGSIQAGITKLKEYRCYYTRDSVNLKKELNNYQWVTYGKVITNIPVDEFNHALDASRYANYSKFFRQ